LKIRALIEIDNYKLSITGKSCKSRYYEILRRMIFVRDDFHERHFMAKSGFYTNRVRYTEMLRLFKQAGFESEVIHTRRWDELPISRTKLAAEFADLSDDDLLTHEWDVLLH
jgi:hypothetical protein